MLDFLKRISGKPAAAWTADGARGGAPSERTNGTVDRNGAAGGRSDRPAVEMGPGEAERERVVYQIGADLIERARRFEGGLLSARFYQDKLMDWAMKDHAFKVQLFRFVDTFPALRTKEVVHEHLIDYLRQPGVTLPPGMSLGLSAGGLAKGAMTATVAGQIERMAANFIAGVDARAALPTLKKLWDERVAFSVDLLGEACVSGEEADEYQKKYLDLIENLPGTVAGWPSRPRLEADHLGPIARTNVSIKISSLSARADQIDPEGARTDLMSRIEPLLETARDRGVFINFDMEQFALKDLTLDLFMHACDRVDVEVGLAMQAYLKSGRSDARRLAQWAKGTGRIVTVRLIKGAYWDYELAHAELMNWPSPVWERKWQTDRCFEEMAEILLDAAPRGEDVSGPAGERRVARAASGSVVRTAPGRGGVKLALGSHNARSIAAALEGLDRRGLPREAIELQMLYGMADELKKAAGRAREDGGMGLRVRQYVPVGEMIPGMAYLVRRLLENTSNESWLRAGMAGDATPEILLRKPGPAAGEPAVEDMARPERHMLSPAEEGVGVDADLVRGGGRPFMTEPVRNFADEGARRRFGEAVSAARVEPIPSDAGADEARAAVDRAAAAFPAWRDLDPVARANVLVRAAAEMRRRRDELAAIQVLEAGKPWREADADVTEAIDFCEYYARFAPGLFRRSRLGRFVGELDEYFHQPRGVCAVISPWNFPLAICCGMTAAALVTGNTVVVKPAEQTTVIAGVMHEIFDREVRRVMPDGVQDILTYLAGRGETAGAGLVRDPRVSLVAFTGSKAVGLDILKTAGVTREDLDQRHVKRVVCEMGGKNAAIVDVSAELDETVLGVRYSAFGFSGQKCSALSRCIVVDPEGPAGAATRLFLDRLVASTRSLVVGDPRRPGTDVGPVIDDDAAERIFGMLDRARAEIGEPALDMGRSRLPDDSLVMPKNLVGPVIFAGMRPEHELAAQEVFGPVLGVMHARTFDEALAIANDHPYKLTGGVYTRRPSHVEKAKREFRVGNLYINRGNTGALVGRHPFGGFGLSGVGSKAGGPDYLLQFVEPRAVAENTMRRGFSPELG